MAPKTALTALLLGCFMASCMATSPLTLKWQFVGGDQATGASEQHASNDEIKTGDIGPPDFSASLFRITLPPCAVRAAHHHAGVHEMHYVTTGSLLAANLMDGDMVRDTLSVGDTFISPKGTIHALLNPSCKASAEFLAFYTNISPEIVSDPQGEPAFLFDQKCVQRCGLATDSKCGGYDYSKTTNKYSSYWN